MSAVICNPVPAMLRPVLYKLDIHLADDEWGNGLMAELAAKALADPRYAANRPLVVSVHEHAGWCLEFALVDGHPTVVGSANDLAVFHGTAKQFREQHQHADVHRAGIILAQESAPSLNRRPDRGVEVSSAVAGPRVCERCLEGVAD